MAIDPTKLRPSELTRLTVQLAKDGAGRAWGVDGGYYLHPNGFLHVDLSCVQLTSTGAYVWQLAVAFDGEFGPDEGPCWYSSGADCECPPFGGRWIRNTSADDYCDSCNGGVISLAAIDRPAPCLSDCTDCPPSVLLSVTGLSGPCVGLNITSVVFSRSGSGCTYFSPSVLFWGISCDHATNTWNVLPLPCASTMDGADVGSGPGECLPVPSTGSGVMCPAFGACAGQEYTVSIA